MHRNYKLLSSNRYVTGFVALGCCLIGNALVLAGSPQNRQTARAMGGCIDGDGDGYGNPGDASCANGSQADCRDDDPAIHPGAAEVCGDSVDNNCDGDIDFGLLDNDYPIPQNQPPQSTGTCYATDPPGCEWTGDPPAPPPGGCCRTPGHKVCNAALDGVECELDNGNSIRLLVPEGPAGDATCFDSFDNDCDALSDHADLDCQSAEVCNGFDDDFDGSIDEDFNIGQPCTVGVGACERTGVTICDGPDAVKCNKTPSPAELEATPGKGKCLDGQDNDCDGLTDLADPGCQTAELCDDEDNDGDGQVDEDFTDLGDICTTGQGACQSDGFFVCKADGSATICNATLNLAASSPEGPAGITCADGIDNDCDGFVDLADPGCGSAGISATCALDMLQAVPNGASCEGHYRIIFETSGAGPGAEVTAELLVLDQQGQFLGLLPVQQNEVAHLKSRLNPNSWAFYSKPNNRRGGPLAGPGNFHTVFAPIPLLRILVKDNLNEAVAYCSPVPFLDVVKPSQTIVDATDNGGTTDVLAALPLVIPKSLRVLVNGVDIFTELGINPATDFPGTHPGGPVLIGGQPVIISDIVVDIAADIETLGSNTLRMKISGLSCGGNDIVVDADGAFPDGTNLPVTPQCHVDDMHDCGASLVFDLQIDSPLEGEITSAVPTPVTGEVCHGLEITQTSINGKQLNPEGQNNFTAGTGECAGGTYKFPIDTALEQTNLFAETIGANTALGTFDPGTNRLIATATDVQAHQIRKSFIFGVGNPSDFAQPLASRPERGQYPGSDWHFDFRNLNLAMKEGQIAAVEGTAIVDAFVFTLEAEALNEFFAAACADAAACIKKKFRESLCAIDVTKTIPIPDVCDPTIRVTTLGCDPLDENIAPRLIGDITCNVTALDGPEADGSGGTLIMNLQVPRIAVRNRMKGACDGSGYWVEIDMDLDTTFPHPGNCGDGDTACTDEQLFALDPPVAPDENEDGEPDCCVPTQPLNQINIAIEERDIGAEAVPVACACAEGDTACMDRDCCDPAVPGCMVGTLVPSDVTQVLVVRDNNDYGLEWWMYLLAAIAILVGIGLILVGGIGAVIIGVVLAVLGTAGLVTFIVLDSVDPSVADFEFIPSVLKEADIKEMTILVGDVTPSKAPYEAAGIGVDLELGTVKITGDGLTVTTTIGLEVTVPDPVEDSLGFLKTPAPPPLPPVDEGNTAITFSDDLLNGIFAAATVAGEITSDTCGGNLSSGICCTSDNLQTVGDLLPDPASCGNPALFCCDQISFRGTCSNDPDVNCTNDADCAPGTCIKNDDTRAIITGVCLGIHAGDLPALQARDLCESFNIPGNPVRTELGRGTCHGIRGASCLTVPSGKAICALVPALNITASDGVLLCARTGIEPRMLISDDGTTPEVEATLHLNDLLVSLVVDRGGNGYDLQELAVIPTCPSNNTNGDCRMLGVCLDLNFDASMQLVQGEDSPEIDFQLGGLIPTERPDGESCEGGISFGDLLGGLADQAAGSDPISDHLAENAEDAVPLQDPENISLGDLVNFENPELFAIKTGTEQGRCVSNLETSCTTDADCGGQRCILFQDYFGVRGTMSANTPTDTDVCTEKCSNEKDDDDDGLIDCDDAVDCGENRACQP